MRVKVKKSSIPLNDENANPLSQLDPHKSGSNTISLVKNEQQDQSIQSAESSFDCRTRLVLSELPSNHAQQNQRQNTPSNAGFGQRKNSLDSIPEEIFQQNRKLSASSCAESPIQHQSDWFSLELPSNLVQPSSNNKGYFDRRNSFDSSPSVEEIPIEEIQQNQSASAGGESSIHQFRSLSQEFPLNQSVGQNQNVSHKMPHNQQNFSTLDYYPPFLSPIDMTRIRRWINELPLNPDKPNARRKRNTRSPATCSSSVRRMSAPEISNVRDTAPPESYFHSPDPQLIPAPADRQLISAPDRQLVPAPDRQLVPAPNPQLITASENPEWYQNYMHKRYLARSLSLSVPTEMAYHQNQNTQQNHFGQYGASQQRPQSYDYGHGQYLHQRLPINYQRPNEEITSQLQNLPSHHHLRSNSRRHTPYYGQPDYRIYEMNKRLQSRTEDSDNLWWDAFATEFFEDDATLTLTFCLEDGPKRYTIGRTLIPRYFRSIFEGEVTDMYFNLKHAKESFHTTSITLDCEQCTMIAHHGKPMYNKMLGGQYPNEIMKEQLAKDNAVVVCTEGRLILEFTFDDLMRIKSWHFQTKQHRELVPRSLIALQAQQQDPAILEQLSKNITRQGLTNSTLNYLRLCVILEPMQELMSRHKAYALNPRDCLKTTLFQKWQRMVAPPGGSHRPGPNDFKMQPEVETQRPPSKRRKRKSSATNNANSTATGGGKKKNNMSPGPPNFSLASQDVMVVGEPSLMGGEFGDEDERLITRLENNQYDASVAAANGLDDGDDFSGNPVGPPGPGNPGGGGGPPPSWSGAPPNQMQDRNQSGGPGSVPQSQNQEDKKPSPTISQ